VLAVPLIVAADVRAQPLYLSAGGLIFSIARHHRLFRRLPGPAYELVSNLGKVMDPVADKLLVSSTLIMLTALGWVPAWAVCIIIGRELAVTGLRNIIAQNKMDVSASWLGNTKPGFRLPPSFPCCSIIHWH
jgi:CDP-diacylglycerol--glycerol-3-phosphate 3-phosphatidyltransferase